MNFNGLHGVIFQTIILFMRFEVITAVSMNFNIFMDVTPCGVPAVAKNILSSKVSKLPTDYLAS
jgi:hypothetical protein